MDNLYLLWFFENIPPLGQEKPTHFSTLDFYVDTRSPSNISIQREMTHTK
jgi:hypothetical protein